MTSTFADSFYFLALLNRNDRAYDRAMNAHDHRRGRLVTTEFVLLEVADAYAHPMNRPAFLGLLDALAADPLVVIEPASATLLGAGLDLYRRRPDKDWPLTDCTSFVVMQREGIVEALTGDHHFEQAGFVALLK
jgi:predicted nucleic acid-binding protein